MPYKTSLISRFESKFTKNSPDSCWIWHGTLFSGSGRAMFHIGTKPAVAARIAYGIYVGSIPIGMLVCHRCDNPKCVNPSHLFVGSSRDNQQDMINKGRDRKAKGEEQGFAKLTERTVREARQRYVPGCRVNGVSAMAREFGVSEATLSVAIRGLTWKHVS